MKRNGFRRWACGIAIFLSSPALAIPPHVPGEILIQLKPSAQSASNLVFKQKINKIFRKSKYRNTVKWAKPLRSQPRLFRVGFKEDSQLDRFIAVLSASQEVDYAEPNYLYSIVSSQKVTLPTDPKFDLSWHLYNHGQADGEGQKGIAGADIQVSPLWEAGVHGKKEIRVAVIDTGIDPVHPDLRENTDFSQGWNTIAENSQSQDDHGHGTMCAGIIGASADNEIGSVGINWKVSLLPIKFIDSQGSGSLANAIEAIDYAISQKVHVMSNSWGAYQYSRALEEAVERAKNAGILFVAAAGNENSSSDAAPFYPANFPLENVIAVAATDNRDELSLFSNYGLLSVHVAAPGVHIFTTALKGKYAIVGGTSMAAPQIAGMAALLLSAHPEWDFAEIKRRLIESSYPASALRRKVVARGRVSLYNAFHDLHPSPAGVPWKRRAYPLESMHPYENDLDRTYMIQIPGAQYIRLRFEEIDLENRYDRLMTLDPQGNIVEILPDHAKNFTSDYFRGDSIQLRIKSDASNTAYGFKLTEVEGVLPDRSPSSSRN